MGEQIRYGSYTGAGRNIDMVNVRRLSENYKTMYVDKYTSSQYLSWAPPAANLPPFLIERARQRQPEEQQERHRRRIRKAEPNGEIVEVPRSTNKPFRLWWNDADSKRRRRVAKYKLYGAEGKMKMSLKKGYCWLKKKCLEIGYH